MRIAVVAAQDKSSRKVAQDALKLLHDRHREVSVRQDFDPPIPDVLIAIGDNRFLLDTIRDVPPQTPVLTVGQGFLAELPPEALGGALPKVAAGKIAIEERLRIQVTLDGRELPPTLNEAALTSSRGAGFLRYSLEVDGERVWRDAGDGVVISTPTGSTGYGLSAGGPVVMENAEALLVVPICSATGQRPLVLPRSAHLMISDVESRLGRVLVLDGRKRYRVREAGFEVSTAAAPARFVRLGRTRYLQVFGKLHSKRQGAELPMDAAPSAKFLFRLLADQGPLSEKQLITESGLPERTVRSALTYLVKAELARRVPSLRDAREAVFALKR
jgi:NAD+ kinase